MRQRQQPHRQAGSGRNTQRTALKFKNQNHKPKITTLNYKLWTIVGSQSCNFWF
jgi:hypothetical protein